MTFLCASIMIGMETEEETGYAPAKLSAIAAKSKVNSALDERMRNVTHLVIEAVG